MISGGLQIVRANQNTMSRFAANERGTIAIIFAIGISAVFGTMALAIDYGRYSNVRTKLWQALDRSALAGAKLLDDDGASDAQIEDRTRSFYLTQVSLLGINVATAAPLTIAIDRANTSVTASAAVDMPTSFAGVLGVNSIHIDQSATVSYKMKKIELSMALDVTGSMSDVPAGDTMTKMEALKSAAKDIVDTMFDLSLNEQSIRIALAPYSSAVNAGSYASAVAGGVSWSNNCVVERLTDTATDTYPSGTSKLVPYDAPVVTDLGARPCPTPTIMPLLGRSARNTLKNEIEAFVASGGTAGHIGTAWGWYMLSDKWASLFPTASKPNVPSGDVVKNLVLMTDGEFNMSYLSGTQTFGGSAVSESYQQFRDLCDNMKTAKVNVYTIGFGLGSSGGSAESELRNCASSNAMFSPPPTRPN